MTAGAVILGALIALAAVYLGRLLAREHHITRHANGPDDLMAVADSLPKRTKLDRELSAFELDEAMRRVTPSEVYQAHIGQAPCGCWWVYLGEGNAQLFPCDEHEGVLEVGRR